MAEAPGKKEEQKQAPAPKAPEPSKPTFTKKDFQELVDLSRELRRENELMTKGFEQFMDLMGDETAWSMLSKAREDANKLEKSTFDLSEDLRESAKHLDTIRGELSLASKHSKDTAKNVSETEQKEALRKNVLKTIEKSTRTIVMNYETMVEDAEGVRDLSKSELDTLIEKTQLEAARIQRKMELGGLSDEELANAQAAIEAADKLVETAQARLKEEEKIQKKLGLTGAGFKAIGGVLDKLGIGDHFGLDKTLDKMRTMAKEGKSMTAIMGAGFKEVGKSIISAFSDPLVVVTMLYKAVKFIIDAFFAVEKKAFDFAKSMGMSVDQAGKLRYSMDAIAMSNAQLALTGQDIADKYKEMSDEAGVLVKHDAEFLTTSTAIQRNLGLSQKQFEAIQVSAGATGKSVKDTYASVIGTAKIQAVNLKINMSEKQVLDGISKVSATVYNNFKGNAVELAKAVVTATKFGTTLNEIESAGKSMLDFESSISKEFEAQLLTGRKLDLSKAREYALTGQTEKLMGEITKQMGTQEQWGRMNVIQQESFAEAMGMSKAQVDEMYKKQEMINLLGDKANATDREKYEKLREGGKNHAQIVEIMGQQSAAAALQASEQDKMNVAMANTKAAIIELVNAIVPIKNIFESIVNKNGELNKKILSFKAYAKDIWNVLKNMFTIFVAIKGVQLAINTVQGFLLLKAKLKRSLARQQRMDENASLQTQKQELNVQRQSTVETTKNTVKQRANTLTRIAGASASLIAAIPLGGILLAAAAAATLYQMLSKSDEGGSESPPSMPSEGAGGAAAPAESGGAKEGGGEAAKPISPMNQAAASGRSIRSLRQDMAAGNMAPNLSVVVNNEVDPITGKTLTSVMSRGSSFDGQSGPGSQVMAFRGV